MSSAVATPSSGFASVKSSTGSSSGGGGSKGGIFMPKKLTKATPIRGQEEVSVGTERVNRSHEIEPLPRYKDGKKVVQKGGMSTRLPVDSREREKRREEMLAPAKEKGRGAEVAGKSSQQQASSSRGAVPVNMVISRQAPPSSSKSKLDSRDRRAEPASSAKIGAARLSRMEEADSRVSSGKRKHSKYALDDSDSTPPPPKRSKADAAPPVSALMAAASWCLGGTDKPKTQPFTNSKEYAAVQRAAIKKATGARAPKSAAMRKAERQAEKERKRSALRPETAREKFLRKEAEKKAARPETAREKFLREEAEKKGVAKPAAKAASGSASLGKAGAASKAAPPAKRRVPDYESESDDSGSVTDQDEYETESEDEGVRPAKSKTSAIREQVWAAMGMDRSRFARRDDDSDDDMEVSAAQLAREEMRSASRAVQEDKEEEERLRQKAKAKAAAKLARERERERGRR